MSSLEPIIGIDLGTTYSCLACWDEKTKKAEVIPTASGRTMPSWVAFTPSGKIVGSSAKSQVASNPQHTIYDIKRIIGRSYSDPVVQTELKSFPFDVVDHRDQPKIRVVQWRGGKGDDDDEKNEHRDLNPEEISAMVLTELKIAAEKYLGRKVSKAVITVPAHFNNQQRQATKDAGRIAGLDVRRIINEPTAAALAYGLHGKTGSSKEEEDDNDEKEKEEELKSNVVIFDLGGGTFDVSVLTMNAGVFEVKATGGDTHLGGEDFDNTVVNWCLSKIEDMHSSKIKSEIQRNSRSLSRLRRAVEIAKRSLSTSSSVEIEVDSILGDLDFAIELSRSTFESLNSDLFTRCIDTVRDVLSDASVSLTEVTDIVLVGGSTRVPFLQSQLYNLFGGRLELCKSVHPDEAVAVGAAVQGHILSVGGTGGGRALGTEGEEDEKMTSTSTDLLLLDVTPLSLGIELEGRVMSTLIKRNTAIPCKKTRTYTTVDDYQTEIDVVVFEGERPIVDSNHKLGSFVISGIQRARAGDPKVDVTFALDANGILNVTARDRVTGSEAKATIKAERGRLSEDDVDRMVKDAERYRQEDEDLAEKTEYKGLLEEALFTAQSMLADNGAKQDDEKELAELMDWLELDSDTATLDDIKGRGRILEDKFGIVVGGTT